MWPLLFFVKMTAPFHVGLPRLQGELLRRPWGLPRPTPPDGARFRSGRGRQRGRLLRDAGQRHAKHMSMGRVCCSGNFLLQLFWISYLEVLELRHILRWFFYSCVSAKPRPWNCQSCCCCCCCTKQILSISLYTAEGKERWCYFCDFFLYLLSDDLILGWKGNSKNRY